jgi:peptidoglycan hydrolase FlgJ
MGEAVNKAAAVKKAPKEDEALRKAVAGFEAMFVNQMFQAMRRSVPESKLFGSGSGEKTFREMLDMEWSNQIAEAGGFGIGEMLYRQITAEPAKLLSEKA